MTFLTVPFKQLLRKLNHPCTNRLGQFRGSFFENEGSHGEFPVRGMLRPTNEKTDES